ncbi:Ig-like domain-containing protein [Burkholderia cenocepacia]|uniref:Ig-like domain-containing protein n=1 Tax=Burkholderia cenocepacia TaxID=95486 RepID=UPI002236F6AA|nr:Ig-like domain-containing protein [Burkholderia cenocepacia]MCW5116892.1 Ig-like domain-containing protein [Burkholderia cenocepacia]MCW5131348.1 Ig-like domain-containing protein [Burkholderia cenocepacia]MCW5176168.1 Ig-like domain-containing protein [Burkholderia cenocepacia]
MAKQKAATRPSRPTIDAVTDSVPPHTGVIEKGGLTNDPRPTMSGHGDPGSTIHILVDGVQVGTAVVSANGTWSFALVQPLSDGEYRLTVRASNEIGMSVPSASYGIQLDTTPPSQPKIDATTEGAQPMLSGQAEAYSTVTIYDGATVLGTVKTGIDGTWTFQLPSGLSNGSHALTVTAQDPAGNTSVRSDGFDVIIGPVAPPVPLTKAVLDDMGHDSGNFNFDRLTNDGTAGRLLSGHLTAALAAGEKVQVSTDGGRTWFDALMKSDGTWVATDPDTHTSNWTIQTRVVNSDGVAGESNIYDVMLDTTGPNAPDNLTFDVTTGVVHVGISKTGVVAGEVVRVIVGNYTIDHTLTQQEIASGTIDVQIPNSVRAALGAGWNGETRVSAAVIDLAGNSSEWRWAEWKARSYDFNESGSLRSVGYTLHYDGLDLTGTMNGKGQTQAGDSYSAIVGNGKLAFVGGIKISLQGFSAHRIDFDFLNMELGMGESLSLNAAISYFDKSGKLIGTQKLLGHTWAAQTFIAPEGSEIGSFIVTSEKSSDRFSGYNTTYLSNMTFDKGGGGDSGIWQTGVEPVHENQIVVELSGAYHGGAGNDVFSVADVRYFDGAGAGVHGGAGIDTLKLTSAGQTLDISKLLNVGGHDTISSIEIIDITGVGNNTLKLSMRDVLELGHENVFRNDDHTQLMVNGNAGDRVELSGMSGLALGSGQWTDKGLIAINGQAYMLYENAALHVELLVQSSVSVQLV